LPVVEVEVEVEALEAPLVVAVGDYLRRVLLNLPH
jgi:hypothetical protein